ncbi:MAG: hypothetical protein WBD73_00915 [Candidatus Acidiferrales bacterium]
MSPLEIAEKIARDHDCRSARRWPIVEDIRRAIEAAKAPILWCCHVRGPDDVHASPDYETALAWSDLINDRFGPHTRTDENYPITRAAPAIWPWSPEAHAESLPKSIAEFTPRGA